MAKHIEGLARRSSPISKFEEAADAIVTGDVATLKRLLRESPQLTRSRSTREHRATLLQDRIDRGEMRHVIAEASSAAKFDDVKGTYTRIIVGGSRPGWLTYTREGPSEFAPEGATRASDPMLIYFTSGTTAKPKMVLHTHASYPVGHLSTMYWIGVEEGDVHWNISSPGWAKHAWSSFFAPWNAGATIFVFNYARFDARRVLAAFRDYAVTTLCAPPTVWRMLILEDLDGYYWYVGRGDDVFKSSDYRISPFELESALLEHECVAEAAVVPSLDPVRLAIPKAYVILKSGVPPTRETAQAIFLFLRNRLAPYKRVRRLEFGELPKTISGKIRRVQLRANEQMPGRPRGATEFWEDDP